MRIGLAGGPRPVKLRAGLAVQPGEAGPGLQLRPGLPSRPCAAVTAESWPRRCGLPPRAEVVKRPGPDKRPLGSGSGHWARPRDSRSICGCAPTGSEAGISLTSASRRGSTLEPGRAGAARVPAGKHSTGFVRPGGPFPARGSGVRGAENQAPAPGVRLEPHTRRAAGEVRRWLHRAAWTNAGQLRRRSRGATWTSEGGGAPCEPLPGTKTLGRGSKVRGGYPGGGPRRHGPPERSAPEVQCRR
ncbi:hypothetical protein NDU88_002771 [Pleurodeles waltl]|uniref:Uncharacterized protein n=1 Tax=Pleurodeles waltl TaxID=8319 RepID=A0AAV7MSD3_PLEWA|nr:hypothetical protein NDU88_002771 [Pleurodeles waltl]